MIRLSTRLNQLNASQIPLVRKFSHPAYFRVVSRTLLHRAVSLKVDGISVVLSFMRQEQRF